MGHHYQRKSNAKYPPPHRSKVADSDELQNAKSRNPLSSNSILDLQRTIGNRAVQRLIRRAPDTADAIQADAGKPESKTEKVPPFVASINGAKKGKFQSKSRTAGHEGKIEILSLQFKQTDRKMTVEFTKEVDDTTPAFHNALLTGEALTSAQFLALRRKEDGKIETLQTFEFSDGIVSSVQYSGAGGAALEVITIEFTLPEEKKD